LPAVVPGTVVLAVPPPPQATMPPLTAASRTSKPSMARQLRRRAGIPNRSRQARTAPPVLYQGTPGCSGCAVALVVALVVTTMSVAFTAATPLMVTGLLAPKLNVGAFRLVVGPEVIAAVRATLPVNPPTGVRVTVEVFPVVAPAATVTAVLLIVNAGVTDCTALDHDETRLGRAAFPSAVFQ